MQKKTVLITGASSGIGLALARLFAEDDYNLVLVARDKEKLVEAAKNLKKGTKSLWLLAKDLSDPKSPQEIYDELKREDITIDVLVNNAGFATYGYFSETNLQEELNELQVNIVTLTHLTKLFLKTMIERKEGKILNIASTAAFLPGPLMAVYYASKAYVLSFSEALANELQGTGVSVTALCPGPTRTDFIKRARLEDSKLFQKNVMDVSAVAKVGYEGLMNGKTIVIPGAMNKLMTEVVRIVPRNIVTKVVRVSQEKRK